MFNALEYGYSLTQKGCTSLALLANIRLGWGLPRDEHSSLFGLLSTDEEEERFVPSATEEVPAKVFGHFDADKAALPGGSQEPGPGPSRRQPGQRGSNEWQYLAGAAEIHRGDNIIKLFKN